MKVEEIIDNDEGNYGQYARLTLKVDGKKRFSIGGGEPEDMTLNRDLSDVFNVVAMMREAYEAGVRGESFDLEEIVEEG